MLAMAASIAPWVPAQVKCSASLRRRALSTAGHSRIAPYIALGVIFDSNSKSQCHDDILVGRARLSETTIETGRDVCLTQITEDVC